MLVERSWQTNDWTNGERKAPPRWTECWWCSKTIECWTETGLLSRIRSGITCEGSTTRCNPLISLLCAARPGSQVVPICTPRPPQCTHKHTRGVPIGCRWKTRYEGLDVPTDTAKRSGCNFRFSWLSPLSYSFFAWSIDFYSVIHPDTAADLVDGYHKQLWQN